MSIIEVKNVSHTYNAQEVGREQVALKDVSFNIEEGEFVALVGHNGSGKSTLAKMLNGLILPTEGSVVSIGIPTTEDAKIFEIRRNVGIVFQNPDNQMVATIIEDDIAFGPENLGIPPKEINERVDWALQCVSMTGHRKGTASRLSGGQKQRIAIAGILAMKPRVLVLDESTSMLDPQGRRSVMEVIKRLNKEEGITVVMITHYMDEAVSADKIILLNKGRTEFVGGREIFRDEKLIVEAGLEVPAAVHIANVLRRHGINLPEDILTADELSRELNLLEKANQVK